VQERAGRDGANPGGAHGAGTFAVMVGPIDRASGPPASASLMATGVAYQVAPWMRTTVADYGESLRVVQEIRRSLAAA